VSTRTLRYDAVVIGAGVAGLSAATRLAQRGASVVVLARGVGSTHLAPATIDVLGYAPGRVDSPAAALPGFVAGRPDHPYALIGLPAIDPALQWLHAGVAAGPLPGYRYVGAAARNALLPTALGVLRPSALVPVTMAGGDAREGGDPVCVVGFPALRDFHATLCAGNLAAAGVAARAVSVDAETGRPAASALDVARRFDDAAFRAAFAARLAPLLRDGERVGLPAVLGVRDPHAAWTDLEQRLERRVFEIPTLPPSVPGLRLFAILRAALRAAGAALALGATVTGLRRDGARATAVRAHVSGHDRDYETGLVVLASGGFASGAIELRSDWSAHETVLGLALAGVPAPGAPRFRAERTGEQPLARAGVAVDGELRAQGLENVFVAGASLPGAEPWREGSGEGIALSSGHRVGDRAA
jgi:glycerol-3-phosphate dehydrogenase subunit B